MPGFIFQYTLKKTIHSFGNGNSSYVELKNIYKLYILQAVMAFRRVR